MAKPKFIGLICYYDWSPLTTMVTHCLRQVLDDVILVRGRWRLFPPIAECEPAPVFDSEMAHRTHAFQQVSVGDYAIIIDSDEIWWGNWPKMKNKIVSQQADLGWVNEIDPSSDSPNERLRIIKISEGLHYFKNHHTIRSADGQILPHSRDRRNSRHRVYPIYFSNISHAHSSEYRVMQKEYFLRRDRTKQEDLP